MTLRPRLKVTLLLTLVLFFPMLMPSLVRADSSGQWMKYSGNPLLGPTSGAWDSGFTAAPVVLYDGAVYRMWYDGGHATATGIGFANSTDGEHWKKYPGPVLQPGPLGSWDSSQIELGSVLWNGTMFLMAYRGENPTTFTNGAIGVAGSLDGISWVKYSGNPILTPGGVDVAIGRPFALRWQTTYNMWYAGRSANETASSTAIRIFYATSSNGMTWSKWSTPVISPSSSPSAWDSATVTSPSAVRVGSNFGLWYTGLNQSGTTPQIGYATSNDGASWNKTLTPVLSPGPLGGWDSAGVEQPDVVNGANGYMMYYDGFNKTSSPNIGLAFAPQNFNVPELPVPQVGLLIAVLACATVCFARRRRV